ncbi:hypothetical protein ACHAXR_004782 [Thalassiosira sp. AJA248-18]
MLPSPLPPLSTLPTKTYPPSSYPPPAHFESSSIIYPALLLPAKRTGEIQKALDEVVFQEPKRKRVYALEEGVDYTPADLEGGGDNYDPKKERKLVLARLGPVTTGPPPDDGAAGTKTIEEGESEKLREAKADRVWQDSRVQSLLAEAAAINNTEDASSNAITTAPPGKWSVRPSYIELPATPYSLLTVDQVLRRIMPTAATSGNDDNDPIIEEVPSSFEIAGHIAHVNLRNESLPYKYLIGRAILEKNKPKIRLVVNKIGTIENEFRTFPMEILAGGGLDLNLVEKMCAGGGGGESVVAQEQQETSLAGDDYSSEEPQVKIGPQHQKLMQVEVKEHGCRFQLDFARVYFNSRLQGEHARVVQQIVESSTTTTATTTNGKSIVVADAMAGVGPFAIPLTHVNAPHYHKTKIVCHANDLNPVSYDYLQKNAKLNKCFPDRLTMYNLDAREFIHKMNKDGVSVDHFIMNLPQMAPEFLDAFRGWKFEKNNATTTSACSSTDGTKRPLIHVHCFGEKARSPDETTRVERQVQERCEAALGCRGCLEKKVENEFQVRVVRDVGPRKNMLCVSFRLPLEVAEVEKLILPSSSGSSSSTDIDDVQSTNGKRGRKEDDDDTIVGSQSPKKSKES